ncbi:MAG: DUF4272 domain-containing protein [Gemmataceae bacterium]|nr:DUF4272 domain-containing protein [Gemmataceae bacterium]
MNEVELEENPDQPPPPIEVARRALILSAVVCRANLERYQDHDYRRRTREEIRDWLEELDLWPHLEPEEKKILSAPFGKLPRRLSIQGTWYVEGLAILAWALRRGDFPPHTEKVDVIAVTNALDFLHPDAAGLLEAPPLRSPDELKAAREWFYDAHCTLGGFLRHGNKGRLAEWIGQFLEKLAVKPEEVMVEGVLAFKGQPLPAADRKELENWEDLIRERHRASIWLVGTYPRYTELPVDL